MLFEYLESILSTRTKGRREASQAVLTPVLRGLAIFSEGLNSLLMLA
jgi:hypothetical protein